MTSTAVGITITNRITDSVIIEVPYISAIADILTTAVGINNATTLGVTTTWNLGAIHPKATLHQDVTTNYNIQHQHHSSTTTPTCRH